MKLFLGLGVALLALLVSNGHAETTMDLSTGWRFALDPDGSGVAQRWFAPEYDDLAWQELPVDHARTEPGSDKYSGGAWCRQRVVVPAAWQGQQIYLLFRNAAHWFTLYCNGQRIAPYGDFGRSINGPALVDLSARVRPGHDNLLALQIHAPAPAAGPVRGPTLLTIDPAQIPPITQPACFVTYADDLATVRVAMRGLGRGSFPGATVEMKIWAPDRSATVAERVVPLPADDMDTLATFSLPRTSAPCVYPVDTVCRDAAGNAIPGTALPTAAQWPGDPVRPASYAGVRVLNNFVAELLDTTCSQRGDEQVTIVNPRAGWVFFRVCQGASPWTVAPELYLDGADQPLALRAYPATGDLEAFRNLAPGQHTVRITGAATRRVIVRCVPELGLYPYPITPSRPTFYATGSNRPDARDFVDRHVLPHVNVLFTGGKSLCGDLFDAWIAEGRWWVGRTHMIDLGPEQPKPGRETYEFWAQTDGVADPAFRGIIVDEFAHAKVNHFGQWLQALKLLDADPHFAGKTYYGFCGEMYQYPHTYDVHRYLIDKNHLLAYEQYLSSASNLAQERCYITRRYVHELGEWQAFSPGVLERMHVCLVVSSTPIGFDTDPRANFNVGLDMQMRCMATEPSLQGIYGVMQWSAAEADEETLRLSMLLYRHYGIEGKTELMLRDPFELNHLVNPDFEFGLTGWDVTAAEPGAVTRGYLAGFSLVPSRYWPIYKGDTFVSMRRSKKGPNRVCQTIKALEPGKLYTFKLFAADLQNLDSTTKLAMAVDLEGVEIVKDLSFDTVFPGGTSVGQFQQVHATLYRIVFRARGTTARLTLSDWGAADQPGGKPDQNLACNYVLVRPYYAASPP